MEHDHRCGTQLNLEHHGHGVGKLLGHLWRRREKEREGCAGPAAQGHTGCVSSHSSVLLDTTVLHMTMHRGGSNPGHWSREEGYPSSRRSSLSQVLRAVGTEGERTTNRELGRGRVEKQPEVCAEGEAGPRMQGAADLSTNAKSHIGQI